MPESFDPYYHWLGIPPHEQPPNHYRLLSVQLFEPNAEVIQNAVDRLMAHLRTFQTGRRAAESQRLLNEISRAKICLLDPKKRAAYDRKLKTKLDPSGPPVPFQSTAAAPTEPTADFSVRPERVTARKPKRNQSRVIATVFLLGLASVAGWAVLGPLKLLRDDNQPVSKSGTADDLLDDSQHADDPHGRGSLSTPVDSIPRSDRPEGPTSRDDPRILPGEVPENGKAVPTTQLNAYDRGEVAGDIRASIAEAHGLVTGSFAVCQSIALVDLELIATQLSTYGYRPIRIRPYIRRDEPLAAVVWKRDGIAWRFSSKPTADELEDATAELANDGYWPVDVAGFAGESTGFVACYVEHDLDGSKPEMLVNLSAEELLEAQSRLTPDNYRPESIHVLLTPDNEPRFSLIWRQTARPRAKPLPRMAGVMRGNEQLISEDAAVWPSDISIIPLRTTVGIELNWFGCPIQQSDSIMLFSGFDPDEHRIRWREAVQRGYTPIGISVVTLQDQTIASSIWTQPVSESTSQKPQHIQLVGPLPTDTPNRPTFPDTVPDKPLKRSAVPDQVAQRQARDRLESQFGVRLANAETTTSKIVLARSLLEAASTLQDINDRYIVLEMAIEQASQAGNLSLAFYGLNQLGEFFEVDTLSRQSEIVQSNRTANRYQLAWMAFELAERARRLQRWKVAEQTSVAGGKVARKNHTRWLSRAFREQLKSIQSAQKHASQAETARQELDSDPEAAEPNLAIGTYLCLVAGKWSEGLQFLTKASDKMLADIARQEVDAPENSDQQLTLADAWSKWAPTGDSLIKTAAQERALTWYVAAFPELHGDEQTRAENQISSLNVQVAQQFWWQVRSIPWFAAAPGKIHEYANHSGSVRAVAATNDARWAISGGSDGTIRVIDMLAGTESRQMLGVHEVLPDVNFVELAANNRILVACGNESRVGLWQSTSGKLATAIPTNHRTRALTASPTGSLFAVSLNTTRDDNVLVFESQPVRGVRSFKSPRRVTSLAFSPDDRFLAGGDEDGHVVLWDLSSGVQLARLRAVSGGTVHDLSFSPNGYQLAAATSRGLVLLGYDSLNRPNVNHFSADSARYLTYLGDGRLATVSGRGTLSLWEFGQGVETQPNEYPISEVHDISAIAALPDSNVVLLGLRSGKTVLWRLPKRAESAESH